MRYAEHCGGKGIQHTADQRLEALHQRSLNHHGINTLMRLCAVRSASRQGDGEAVHRRHNGALLNSQGPAGKARVGMNSQVQLNILQQSCFNDPRGSLRHFLPWLKDHLDRSCQGGTHLLKQPSGTYHHRRMKVMPASMHASWSGGGITQVALFRDGKRINIAAKRNNGSW